MINTEQTPWHPNLSLANSTHPWNSSDSKESYQRLCENPVHQQYFKEQGWDQDLAISYRFNQFGFRGADFATNNNLLTLGCSFTMGVGLPESAIWPSKLAQALGLTACNISWGGNSMDGCFRMAEFWIPKLKPQVVALLAPPLNRHELCTDSEIISFVPEDQAQYIQDWYIKTRTVNEENSRLNFVKNKLAIAQLCSVNKARFIMLDSLQEMSRSREEVGYARDHMHAGPKGHELVVNKFLKSYYGT